VNGQIADHTDRLENNINPSQTNLVVGTFMVPGETVKTVLPNISRSVPGGGGVFWRCCSRGILTTMGYACKGFLKLQRNVRVEGMDAFLKILESKRDRGVLTGLFAFIPVVNGSF
jgi:hypothetical protein